LNRQTSLSAKRWHGIFGQIILNALFAHSHSGCKQPGLGSRWLFPEFIDKAGGQGKLLALENFVGMDADESYTDVFYAVF
jgi:hypothetical protein